MCPQRLLHRLYYFYTAPLVQYALQTASFVALLLLFSFSALSPTVSLQDGAVIDQTLFLVNFVWMSALILDEFRQILVLGGKQWWASAWNRWDTVTYLLYTIAFVLRLSSDPINLGRSRYVYSLVAAMLWMRLARQYAVNQSLGPNLIMIQLMVRDIVVFLALMFVVFAGYAVALYSVLHQDRPWDEFTLIEMAFIPYFQVRE